MAQLISIHGGPGTGTPPWSAEDERKIRETFEETLREADHFVILAIVRLPDNKTKTTYARYSRGNRTSFLEMVGAVHDMLHDWFADRR